MKPILTDEELFARLIAFDSTSVHSNRPIADFICDYLDRPGLRIERNLSPDEDKLNLVVFAGPEVTSDRSGLVLSAHMDVVPAGDGWSTDPFALTDRGDRWLGRGTADMKGFLTLAVNAAARVEPQSLRQPLVLALTFDEELGCLGARHLAETWPREDLLPRHAVIGEPTSFKAVRMHKGHLKLQVTVQGVNAHSGYPHLGSNAIEPTGRIVTALSELRHELEQERPTHHQHFPDTPFVALNVGIIHGGAAINVVPDRCELGVGLRLLPGMSAGPTLERVQAAVDQAMKGAPTAISYEVEVLNEAPPMLLGSEAPIYRAVCDLTGQAETISASYGTDAAWLQHLGMDCVIFGPGTIEVAHKPDEWLAKEDLAQGAGYVEQLVDQFCLAESGA